ncbi:ATP-binding cassette domain-containing protein, partial [Mesorhizobium sp. M0133]|uniref:ATP-binding cassette domain-containing protein n=1 Tax=Mesorhizobium sp. M0133 TaxID=2956888 RepID=UPI00333944FD
MTALAEVRDLSVRYRRDGGEVTALKGVSLDVIAGERLAIIGESGSGKSTLALAVAGLLPASAKIEGHFKWQFQAPRSFPPPSVGGAANTPPRAGEGQMRGGGEG